MKRRKTFPLRVALPSLLLVQALGGCAALDTGLQAPPVPVIIQGDEPVLQIRDLSRDNAAQAARIELLERAGGKFDGGAFVHWNGEDDKLHLGTTIEGRRSPLLTLDRSSQSVGIGTSEPSSRLAVDGRVTAREVVVTVEGWPDDVFEAGYPLPPLTEVERWIESRGHLPGIPSEAEVAAGGVPLGGMQTKLLRKIEELTLYLLELWRLNGRLEKRVEELEAGP